ncbi:Lipoprotein [Sulfitobacter noctilucae]|uniref:DUF6778 family protein n=1 Tax=Sulfitobacter noctilucae TaxID=1342302 RepID=UPI0004681F70|nr:DUF6778 family protein [Sulfitobacter noctilucae]KIN60870.1 Lipoprotein [Sulfitobacter noctilucae]
MRILKLIAAIPVVASLAACAAMPDIASRNAPFEAATPTGSAPATNIVHPAALTTQPDALPVSVSDIRIVVPRALSVSETNTYYPKGDIVWRGDPIGDRHAQVKSLFENGFAAGTADMNGQTPVTAEVEVVRFHSVTEKTRYTVGGVHNIVFDITVRRASTGQALAPTRRVEANLPALGGRSAIEADRAGQTQRVRVTDHLAQVIRHELARFVQG